MKRATLPRPAINWQEVRIRLAAATAATSGAGALSPEQGQAVMRARSATLAAAGRPAEDSEAALRVVFFTAGGQRFALEASWVLEIRKLTGLCRIPGVPPFVLGISALRGEMVAVIDLGRLNGGQPADLGGAARLLVLGDGAPEFAIAADKVESTGPLSKRAVSDPADPATVAGRAGAVGVTADGCILLDGAALMDDERLIVDAHLGE